MSVSDPANLGVRAPGFLGQALNRAFALAVNPFTKSCHRLKKYPLGTLLVKQKVPLWIQTDSYPRGTMANGK